jgi:uncharacterized membrane protein YhaH (DUF805 family)
MLPHILSFEGRIKRGEYAITIFPLLFLNNLVIIPVSDHEPLFGFLALLLSFWVLFAQGAKRCHDVGNNGWYQIIPFYSLVMLFKKGQFEDNEFGPSPYIERFRAE